MFAGTTWWDYVRNVSEKIPGADAVINQIVYSETLPTPQVRVYNVCYYPHAGMICQDYLFMLFLFSFCLPH